MISLFQIIILAEMGVFYAAYFAKQYLQHRQGLTTMVLGEGKKPAKERWLERLLKLATFMLPAVELVSIFVSDAMYAGVGCLIGALGVLSFVLGMSTMRDSWRAGIPEQKETSLVTTGIYSISRNPAFLGFDLLYIGILLAYPNVLHACIVLLNIVLFHLQILNEERFLETAFGQEYQDYKKKVRRYL